VSAQLPVLPVYLEDGTESVFGLFHEAAAGSPDATAILICPPFGWDDICSYRSRRDWAEHLAAAGHPTLRIDLPGTGDSSGASRDHGQLSAWTSAVARSAQWLHDTTASHRVAAIGIGLGGLMICKAISEDASIDEVVLWGVPARGRTFVRELRAFASLENTELDEREEVEQSRVPEGSTWAGGFLLSAETTQALKKLDVTELAIPPDRVARALLLDRDGIGPDARLHEHLAQAGVEVTVAPGAGYGAMMAKPHLARSPNDVFAQVLTWVEQPSLRATPARSQERLISKHRDLRISDTLDLSIAGTPIRETPLTVDQPFGQLFGILAEPINAVSGLPCAIMLNAGAIRRVGPNRMWVEIARRWAALGVPTLRLDLEGIGDADGSAESFTELASFYAPQLVDQVCAAIDTLEARGMDRPFILAGLCSGACWAFHGALRDERVSAAFMLNPRTLFWDPSLATVRDYRRGLLRPSSWRSVLRGEVPLERILTLLRRAPLVLPRRALTRWYTRHASNDELDRALDELRDKRKHLEFLFSGNEPLWEELEQEGRLAQLDRWLNVNVEFLPGAVHTLRPYATQRAAHEALNRALDGELQHIAVSEAQPEAVR
jgi:alpha-beta hydrolase superfamily lysophospholipase